MGQTTFTMSSMGCLYLFNMHGNRKHILVAKMSRLKNLRATNISKRFPIVWRGNTIASRFTDPEQIYIHSSQIARSLNFTAYWKGSWNCKWKKKKTWKNWQSKLHFGMASFISLSLKVRKVQLAAYKIAKIKYIKDLIDLQQSGFAAKVFPHESLNHTWHVYYINKALSWLPWLCILTEKKDSDILSSYFELLNLKKM